MNWGDRYVRDEKDSLSGRLLGALHQCSQDGGGFCGNFQAELTILHVVEPLTYNELPNAVGRVEHQIRTYLADELKQFDVNRELVHGDPAEQIVQYAHAGNFDLIMLPTHGYGRFRRFIIGSVAAKVLHDANCPVWTGVHMEKMLLAVMLGSRGTLFAVLFPVTGMAAAPFTRTVAAHLTLSGFAS